MIAIWGSKEHLTYVFPLWFSHDGQKSLKNVPKPSKNTSLLSAQAGIYILLPRGGDEPGRETTLFQEMCARLARNHTFPRNGCPSYTKPHFFKKCVPLLHETTLFCKNTESRTRGYVNNSRNLPTSRTQRTQGRNIPFGGTPHSDKYKNTLSKTHIIRNMLE